MLYDWKRQQTYLGYGFIASFYFIYMSAVAGSDSLPARDADGDVKESILDSQNSPKSVLPLKNRKKSSRKQPNKLHEILRKKEELEGELSRIKFEEAAVKQKRVIPMDQSRTKYFRSTTTSEQKMRISQILRQTNKFQRQSAKKTDELLTSIEKQRQAEKIQQQERQKSLSLKKKQIIAENLKQIERRKLIRTKEINKANREFQRVSKQTFLHQSIDKDWKIIEATEEEQNERMLANKRAEQKFNAEQIKAHARRYSNIVRSQRQQRDQAAKMIRQQLVQHSRLSHYPTSTFFKTISEQEAIDKKKNFERTQQPHIFKAKSTIYAETIKQINHKSIKRRKSPPPQNLTDIRTAKSLDNLGLAKLGNQYMKQMHSSIKEIPVNQTSNAKVSGSPHQSDKIKYPDYLTKNRQAREASNPEHQLQDIVELKRIIKKKDQDDSTRLYKAKAIAQKLDNKVDGSSKSLISSIAAKLSIIQQFSASLK